MAPIPPTTPQTMQQQIKELEKTRIAERKKLLDQYDKIAEDLSENGWKQFSTPGKIIEDILVATSNSLKNDQNIDAGVNLLMNIARFAAGIPMLIGSSAVGSYKLYKERGELKEKLKGQIEKIDLTEENFKAALDKIITEAQDLASRGGLTPDEVNRLRNMRDRLGEQNRQNDIQPPIVQQQEQGINNATPGSNDRTSGNVSINPSGTNQGFGSGFAGPESEIKPGVPKRGREVETTTTSPEEGEAVKRLQQQKQQLHFREAPPSR